MKICNCSEMRGKKLIIKMKWMSLLLDKEKVFFKKQFNKKVLVSLKATKEAICNKNRFNNN